jgi:hypothetical protein
MEKESIHDIAHRANINHKKTSKNEVIVYEDHRTILNAIYHLKAKRNISEALDLVMFDNHDDFCTPREPALKKVTRFLKNPSFEKLYHIVEFDLSELDDDWVKMGMELGLIGNVFLFNSDESSVPFRQEYKTKKFGKKFLYNVGDVWSALGYQGKLNDPINEKYSELVKHFGYEIVGGNFRFSKNRNKFILDIDLDCFSTKILDKTIAIPEELIVSKLRECQNGRHGNRHSSEIFIKDLIKDSELVTICFETSCCGGIREAYKIFSMVDRVFFDNEIGG